MKKAAEKAIEQGYLQTILSWLFLIVCVSSMLLYAFFINRAIFQAVEEKQVREAIAAASMQLNLTQSRYLSLKNSATLAKAHELGFSEADSPKFISKKSLGRALSLSDEI